MMDYVLIADQAALPALLKRLERLSGGRVVVLAERACGDTPLATLPVGPENTALHWVSTYMEQPFALNATLRGLHLPQGQTQAWVACRPAEAELIRCQLIEDHGVAPERIEYAPYPLDNKASSAATVSGLKPAMT